jgi:uncharacterized protein (DUF2147 family)
MKARLLAAALGVSVSANVAAAQGPDGTWLTQSGQTKVHVAKCGQAYCGTVVWQKSPTNDTNNPDSSKRDRPVVGIQLIYGMTPSGPDQWTGQLYNFEDGKTYTGKLSMAGDSLKLAGCVMGGLICRSQTWTRSN